MSPCAEGSGNRPPRPNHPRKLHFRGTRYRGTPPQRGTLFRNKARASSHILPHRGTCSATRRESVTPPVVKGNLDRDGNVPSSPPLEGWATPGPARCVAWVVKPGVVRDCGIIHLIPCHSRVQPPRKCDRICGVDKAGILYPFSNNSCHSRVGGNRAWVVNSYLIGEYSALSSFYLSVIRSTNLIDPIPACAGMTRVVCVWALGPLCHRERSVAIQ